MINKLFLEYIWLDGYKTQNLRSKIKVIDYNAQIDGPIKIDNVPEWNFDGSSTMQATGSESECILRPARLYQRKDGSKTVYVLCEVMNTDETFHETNTRIKLVSSKLHTGDPGNNKLDFWWGFEQEYFMMQGPQPAGFPSHGYPKAQGEFYCGIGNDNVKHRDIAEQHMYECLALGIEITGINAEVALGQWEYQVFSKDTLKACDDLWMSRYLLHKMSEAKGITINLMPKPVKGDWNGSGCHTNFSNEKLRTASRRDYFEMYLANLGERHALHIAQYGEQNKERLTGEHETQRIEEYSYGIGDRGASIRIPNSVVKDSWCGYLEDRRPAANCDPYTVTKLIIEAKP